jgi:hypothetical protein
LSEINGRATPVELLGQVARHERPVTQGSGRRRVGGGHAGLT